MLKAFVGWLESLVYSTSVKHFLCSVPEASTNIVTILRVVVCVWHIRLVLKAGVAK